eukprot:TRINITY_DN12883_c0_g1_i1.p1 TRINITY_DN12883_c0_g1~~TRINITY_DN12883_c0_g1_i1.p1  ORF type:complete len:432 (-),score=90.41 TRINITY_DN12883_c0_g1_i1:177-1472(-)
MSSSDSLQWKFSQVFGENPARGQAEVNNVDIVSAIEFDHSGEFIAAGDRGGRVVIFKLNENNKFRFHAEFQSHEPEFDYLKSLEIEPKINKIRWRRNQNDSQFLLTTNDKTIKLWNVHNKRIKQTIKGSEYIGDKLSLPKIVSNETVLTATPRKIFSNGHAYNINSISLSSDGETYISADDMRINLWNLSITDQSFNVVDIKPPNMEDLTEVITAAEFHPIEGNLFIYSSSKGAIKLADLRSAALCDTSSKVFEEEENPANRSFFSEIISSVSDVKFSHDGRYILARDYLTLKVWDIKMEAKPVQTFRIHDHLRYKLCDLYENDCIFDKFECAFSSDGSRVMTGSYNNLFSIFDTDGKGSTSIEATKTSPSNQKKKSGFGRSNSSSDLNPDRLDYNKKILQMGWHPHDNLIAVAASNRMFIYTAESPKNEL